MAASSMIVHNLDVGCVAVCPNETDSPPIVYPDTVLSKPIALQRLELVIRWHLEITEPGCRLQHPELPPGDLLKRLKSSDPLGRPKLFSVATLERPDHN